MKSNTEVKIASDEKEKFSTIFLDNLKRSVKNKNLWFGLISIVIGFLASAIILAILNVNAFDLFFKSIKQSFDKLFLGSFIDYACLMIVLGISAAVSFRSGLFNIGASGQMLFSAIFTFMFAQHFANSFGKAESIIIVLLLSIILSSLYAGIAGALKAFFNVHEVITTIMLNWVALYLTKFFMTQGYIQTRSNDPGSADTNSIQNYFINLKFTESEFGSGSAVFLPIMFVLIIGIAAFVIMKYTNAGKKQRATWLNQTAGLYSGYNIKMIKLYSMLISGAIVGVASVMFYFSPVGDGSLRSSDMQPPNIGFNGIAVALVAMNNPVGILFSGILFALLQGPGIYSSAAILQISPNMTSLFGGVILYFVSFSNIFVLFIPTIKKYYKKIKSFKKTKTDTPAPPNINKNISKFNGKENENKTEQLSFTKTVSINLDKEVKAKKDKNKKKGGK